MAVKLADTLAPMAEFPVALAENIDFTDGKSLQEKYDLGELGGDDGPTIEVDSSLDTTSTNPVQNKVVTEKFKTTQKSFEMVDAGPYEEGYFIITPPLYSHFILSTKYGEQVKVIGGSSSDSKYNAIRLSNSLESEGNRILHIYVNDGNNVLFLKVTPDTSLSATGLDESPVFRIASLPDNLTEIPIESLGGGKAYTSLAGLNLTAGATFQDVITALPEGASALLGVTEFTNYQTIFPYEEGNDQFARVFIVKGVADGSRVYARWFRKDGVKEAIAKFNINDNLFNGWQLLKSPRSYTSLTSLGLTADSTLEDVVNALNSGDSFLAPVNTFTNYETIFPNKVPSDQWNKVQITKGSSLPNSHIRVFSQSGVTEYLANMNNTNITGWNDISGTYIDISDSVIEKLGTEILKYPVGRYRINSTTTGAKFTDLPPEAPIKCGVITINGTAVDKSPFTDTWVYRMYTFECLIGYLSYTRRLNSGATAGQIEVDSGWHKEGQETYTSLAELGLTAAATIDDVRGALKVGESCLLRTDSFSDLTQFNGIQWGYLKITVGVNKMSDIWLNDVTSTNSLYYGRQSGGLFHSWVRLSSQSTYTELVSLGLTAEATVDDVLGKLQPGETFISGVTQFTNYQTLFPYDSSDDQYSRVFIQQGSSPATAYLKWFRKDGSREALGNLNSSNKLVGWNAITMNEIIHTSLTESLSGITSTLALVNALITEYRAKNKPVKFLSGGITKTTFADLPTDYGLLDITVAGYDVVRVSFASSSFGFKTLYYGLMNRTSSETLFSSLTWSKASKLYFNLADLQKAKGITLILDANQDNTLKIINALSDGEEFMDWYSNSNNRFGIPPMYGSRINILRIQKTSTNYATVMAITDYGKTFSRVYNNGTLENWCWDKSKQTLVTNTTTNLKLDITKRNSSFYGSVKLTYLYATSPVEVEIDFRAATDPLKWTIAKGQKYVKAVTFTQEAANKAHYTVGIEFSGTTYGCYQAEVIGDFADINSLTAETFTGDTAAIYGNPYGKNNGVTLVSAPEDIGVTSPCTTVQLVQAMRNTFNKTITSGAIGVFNNGGSTITDAPVDYGLLHIEVYGHDRTLIRFDGIGGSTYAGSWIGKVQGNNGTFSGVNWERVDNKYSTGEIVIGEWIDGSPIYRKVLEVSNIEAKTTSTTVELGDAPVSGQNMLKIEGFVNLIGNQFYVHYPKIVDEEDSTINANLSIANGHVKLTGTWKYPIGRGAIIMEYKYN